MARANIKQRRAARAHYEEVAAHSEPGTGARSKALEASVAAGGARDPGAVIGMIGRRKYGAKQMGQWSGAGRHRAAVRRGE